MRSTAMQAPTKTASLPRGWIVVGMALASWLVVAALWTGMSGIFGMIVAAV